MIRVLLTVLVLLAFSAEAFAQCNSGGCNQQGVSQNPRILAPLISAERALTIRAPSPQVLATKVPSSSRSYAARQQATLAARQEATYRQSTGKRVNGIFVAVTSAEPLMILPNLPEQENARLLFAVR